MLFSALLMAILIVRMVGYHYTVSDRQQQTFRFMLKASDIGKKLVSSSDCLSRETFLYRSVIDREKLDDFVMNYSDTEPLCAYDYDLGWRAKVTEKSFTYVSPALLTTLSSAPGDWMNASELLLMTPYRMNVSLTNSSGQTRLEDVDGIKSIAMDQVVNFSATARVWAISRNYVPQPPRDSASVAVIGAAVCSPDLDQFPSTLYSNTDPSGLFDRLQDYQALLFHNSSGYSFLPSHHGDLVDFLHDGRGIVVVDESFSFWEGVFSDSPHPLALGLHSACEIPELSSDCNLTSGVYFSKTVPAHLALALDQSRGKTPGDVVSMYGIDFRTFVDNRLWLIAPFNNTHVRVADLSDGDDFIDTTLDAGESTVAGGFDSDLVSVHSNRPVWTIAGDEGGYTWLEGSHLLFPSFGSFAVIAPQSSTISVSATTKGDYAGEVNVTPATLTLQAEGVFRVNKTQESGYRWISLNSTLPVIVETWSDHGMIEKLSSLSGDGYETRTMGVGNITICAGAMAVSFGDETYTSGHCSSVRQSAESYRFVSDAPFLMVQTLGGDGADQTVQPQPSDDEEASAIADATGSDMLEPGSASGSYNLFYLYRASYPVTLPASRKGVVLLYNSREVFGQFGVVSHTVFTGCTNWTLNTNASIFSTPNNVTESELEARPFEGCTFYHTFDGQTRLAVSSDHNLERIVDLRFPNGDPVVAASLKPAHTGQLAFVQNLGRLASDNIFSSEASYAWEFGANATSVGPSKRQEITLRIPVAIYYNETKVKPGELELHVYDGELEQFRGAIERSCMEENVTEVMDARVSAPLSISGGALCQGGSCKRLVCPKNVTVDLNAGFRIIRVSSNETGVFIG